MAQSIKKALVFSHFTTGLKKRLHLECNKKKATFRKILGKRSLAKSLDLTQEDTLDQTEFATLITTGNRDVTQ